MNYQRMRESQGIAVEREFDPNGGDLGRGVRVENPPTELSGYTRFHPYGDESELYRFPVYGSDGLPDGWMWEGWVRFNHNQTRGWVVAFESKATPEEKAKLLDALVYFPSGGPRAVHVRDIVADPEEWLAKIA